MEGNLTTQYILNLIRRLAESDEEYDATAEEYRKNGQTDRVVITIQRRGESE